MIETDPSSLVAILRCCVEAAPEPWYPSVYAREKNIDRDRLDPSHNRLRLGGLIQLTYWVHDNNQGYRLTAEGERALQDPKSVNLLQEDQLPPTAPPEELPSEPSPWHKTAYERGEIIRAARYEPAPPV